MTFRLSRRTFLRGQGALIALPFLEAMLPSRAHAQTAAPVRYALLYFPNGTTADWAPGTTGTNYQLTSVMAGLQPFKADITVCTNVHNPTASYHPGHATGFAVGKSPPPSGAPFDAAVSVDQYIANAIGSKTRVKSLAMTPPGNGNSESGQSGVYGSNLSWVSATTPAARSVSPREIFETLMAGATPGQPQPSGVDERIARQKSVLDFVLFDANRLRTKLGSTDRATLDQFLTNVREVEQKLSATPPPPPSSEPAACGAGTRPNDSYPFEQDLELKLDLMALAFQCDITRVATHLLDFELSSRDFSFAGVSGSHHLISHWKENSGTASKLKTIVTFYFNKLAYLLGKLKAMPEAGSTVLDNSMILFGSGFNDGHDHTTTNIPVILAGRGGGALNPGRCVKYPNDTQLPHFHLAMIRKMGVQLSSFNGHSAAVTDI